jgi:4-hydroxy-3-polyprenylbenzoate decarboxylase
MQVYDKRTTGMHFHWHKDGARHLRQVQGAAPGRRRDRLRPGDVLRRDAAAAPRRRRVPLRRPRPPGGTRLTKCETLDIEVPANAEIILEGTVDPDERRREGPFGDHTGYYSLEDDFPVFRVNAITHRAKPVYHTTIVGRRPGGRLHRLRHRAAHAPAHEDADPELVDYHMPMEGVFHNLMIVSIQKRFPATPAR